MSKIGLLIVVLLPLLTNTCGSQKCTCNDALNFAGDNTQEYGISRGLEKSLIAVSACFWISTPASYQKTHASAIISYSISGGNDFLIWIETGSLRVIRPSAGIGAPVDQVTVADGLNHHVCITWDLSTGKIEMYVDGRKRFEVHGTKYRTASLPTGGTWIIGQDQDRFEGGFDKKDSMKGVLAEVNIWDRILCPYEIAALASSCGPIMKGNVKAHNDFTLKGGVQTFKPDCCMGY